MKRNVRITACVLLLLLLAAAMPSYAKGADRLPLQYSFTVENPVYEEAGISLDLPEEATACKKAAIGGVYVEKEDLASALRSALVAHQTQFSAQINIEGGGETSDAWRDNLRAMVLEVYRAAVRHTGAPFEGDYIKFHFGGLTANAYGVANDLARFNCTLVLDLRYYGTASEDSYVNTETDRILNSLNLNGLTAYEKLRAINGYITTHVSYDYEHVNDTSYSRMFTAYAALYDGKAVCQGFANLFYVMALKAGVDVRIIGGSGITPVTGNSIPHAWNIVKIGNRYYNVDPTWDAETATNEQYFLQPPSSFNVRHTRDAEYDDSAFHMRYPMETSDYVHGTAAGVTDVMQLWISRTLYLADSFTLANITSVTPDTAADKSVTYYSTNTDVLEIMGTQAVAVAPGVANLVARSNDGGIESSCEVTVLNQSRIPDLFPGRYYTRPIIHAYVYGYLRGTDMGYMLPDEGCTRAQAVTMLWRVHGMPTGAADVSRFSDVPSGAYYTEAVRWALANNITTGVEYHRFAPDLICTREQITTLLYRIYSGGIPADHIPLFTDVARERYSFYAIQWAGLNHVVEGVGNGSFAPEDTCTRGQIATMIYRTLHMYGS